MQKILRREFIKTALAGGIGAAILPEVVESQAAGQAKTRYIAAYDTESPACLPACRKIVEVHKRFEMPATFFIVGKTLDANPAEYRKLLEDPLFEIASHTYSHQMLRDNVFCGQAISMDQRREEISSLLWGPDYSLPALLREPFSYKADGFPEIWELPGHGWHENLLKDHNRWGPRRLTLWPPPFPEAIPRAFCKTAEDEFEVNKVFLDKGVETGKPFVSLIWHPWSLAKFDPDMKMLELTFTHVRRLQMIPSTYAQLHKNAAILA